MADNSAPISDPSAAAHDAPPPTSYGGISAEALLSLGCMEGVYEPIVAPVLPVAAGARHVPHSDAIHGAAYPSLDSMEGIPGVMEPVVERAAAADEAARSKRALRPGYAAASVVAGLAYVVHYLPFAPFTVTGGEGAVRHAVSAAIIAILLGLVLRNTMRLPDSLRAGCKRAVRKLIPIAIVCTGAGMNLKALAAIGVPAFFITVVCIVIAISGSFYIGRLLGLSRKTSLLLGAGTGICGNSAIVAVAPLIDAGDDDVALSVGAVNLFGLVTMLALPAIGGFLAMSDEAFGIWSGTSIHAVPQVVAAGFAFSPAAGATATLVKLVRVTLLAPLVFVLAIMHAKQSPEPGRSTQKLAVHYARFVPWFVWGFGALALLNTFGMIPTLDFALTGLSGDAAPQSISLAATLKLVGKVLLTIAMAAIGLEINVRQLAGVGAKAITAGFITSTILAVASLTLIMILI